MLSFYFSWLAEEEGKKKKEENKKIITKSFLGGPSLQLFMPVFLELMRGQGLWGGGHLIHTIYLGNSLALALAQPAWPLRPSHCADTNVQLSPRFPPCPSASLPGCLCTLHSPRKQALPILVSVTSIFTSSQLNSISFSF